MLEGSGTISMVPETRLSIGTAVPAASDKLFAPGAELNETVTAPKGAVGDTSKKMRASATVSPAPRTILFPLSVRSEASSNCPGDDVLLTPDRFELTNESPAKT